jgi:hypothetical protein
VLVKIPGALNDSCHITIKPQMTFYDVLRALAKHHKINLFTEEYTFSVNTEDQVRLKLSSIYLPLHECVEKIDCKSFELRRKVFQDSSANKKQGNNSNSSSRRKQSMVNQNSGGGTFNVNASDDGTGSRYGLNGSSGAYAANDDLNQFRYTKETAVLYQEWYVIKKNNIGRKQERVLGIDGKKIYNHKRGESRGKSDVRHPDRDISTIVRVDPSDQISFKIILSEDSTSTSELGYVCERESDLQEILAKLAFLMDMVSYDKKDSTQAGSSLR